MGDAERPPLAEAMDHPRARQEADRLIKLAPLNGLAQPGDRGRRGIGESEQEMAGIAAVAGVLLQGPEALGIVGPAVAQTRAKHLLQLGKAGESQRLSEAHQSRGLHLGVAGDDRSGAQREFVGVFECISRGLAETPRQVRLDLDQSALEVVKALRRLGRDVAHRFPRGTRRQRSRALLFPSRHK